MASLFRSGPTFWVAIFGVGVLSRSKCGVAAAALWLLTASAAVASIEAASQAFDQVRLDAASRLLQEHEQRAGPSAHGLYLESRISIMQGELDAALKLTDACVDQFPRSARCYEAKGEAELIRLIVKGGIFGKIGAARGARKALETAVELDPANLRARLLLVRFHTLAPWLLGGRKSKARDHVAACQEQDPAWGYEAQALFDMGTGNLEAAVEGFASAQVLRPRERDPALYLARAYLASNKPGAAIDTLERLVDQYPSFQEAWLEIGQIAASSGLRSARGMAALEHFLQHADSESADRRVNASLTLARLYVAADRPSNAVEVLQGAVELAPKDKRIKRLLASLATEAG